MICSVSFQQSDIALCGILIINLFSIGRVRRYTPSNCSVQKFIQNLMHKNCTCCRCGCYRISI